MNNITSITYIDFSVINENYPDEHCQKTTAYFGGYFGFRGSSEHVKLVWSNIEKGVFPVGRHPWAGADTGESKTWRTRPTN